VIDPIEIFAFFFAISLCAWGLFGLYISIRIERFIVKRYEQETDLLDTVFFKEHATFSRYLPDFFSSAMYTAHLLMCVWGWWLYEKRKAFRDIKDPYVVIRHFSKKEIRWAKWFALSCTIVAIHGVAYLVFRSIWPDVFNPKSANFRREEIMELLRQHKQDMVERFGIIEIGIFGSMARGEAQQYSDVDVVVKTKQPDLFMLVHLKEELEKLLNADVDIVRYWPRMNPYLERRIDREARYV
jgi:predicted nucleotidyltransferase